VRGAETPSDLRHDLTGAFENVAAAAGERAKELDARLRELIEESLPDGISVVAVGGFGRGHLCPYSDIDLLFVAPRKAEITPAGLRGLLYPLWDSGHQVGHYIGHPKEVLLRAESNVHALTALLSARFVGGDSDAYDELIDRRERWITQRTKRIVREILDATRVRHARMARAGWVLAPDLKDAPGALRDLNTIEWLGSIDQSIRVDNDVARAGRALLATRSALHETAGRKCDVLHIDLQPAVARLFGMEDESGIDDMMSKVHWAARKVEYATSIALAKVADRVLGGPKRSGTTHRLEPDIAIYDGGLRLTNGASASKAAGKALRLAAWSSATARPIASDQHPWMRAALAHVGDLAWDEEMRNAWAKMLQGHNVREVLELLDNLDALPSLMPDWVAVRGRAQFDPYHRYTVDGHCFVAVAEVTNALEVDDTARNAAFEIQDLNSLYLAALLHDIGKGSGEDHCIAGERKARAITVGMGFDEEFVAEVASLVRKHLLLVDTATRRDLDDGSVIESTAKAVGSARLLRLLYILTVADARATGPEAWSEWKAALVRELYRKTLVALETGELPVRSDTARMARALEALEPELAGQAEPLLLSLPPSYLSSVTTTEMADELLMLHTYNVRPSGREGVRVRIEDAAGARISVTVCVADRPGALARTAGVLSLHRMSIVRAQAYSSEDGTALQRFVAIKAHDANHDLEHDLRAAYSGRLALDAHMQQKAADYRTRQHLEVDVRILNDASEHSTIIEVRSHDAIGLLYSIASALASVDANIHVAKIDTLGPRVVDVFYVRTPLGAKLDAIQGAEAARAIHHRINQLLN
jgi:[protein-PII] uridylyltransferase